MTQRGRQPDPLRAAARAAGERFYCDALPCETCGDFERYAVNGACVTCARHKGSARYAALDASGLEIQKQKDHARYIARRAAAEAAAQERIARRARRSRRTPLTDDAGFG